MSSVYFDHCARGPTNIVLSHKPFALLHVSQIDTILITPFNMSPKNQIFLLLEKIECFPNP